MPSYPVFGPPPPFNISEDVRKLLETQPLYKKLQTEVPTYRGNIIPNIVYLDCFTCSKSNPYHLQTEPELGGITIDTRLPFPTTVSGLHILKYRCSGCMENIYNFFIEINVTDGWIWKAGQTPPFDPPTPSRVISLMGQDREIFLQGRRAEIQGLGIGAFAYYRRVVENQKGRLIEDMAKVAKLSGASPQALPIFDKAANEVQFSKAIDYVKDYIPKSLLIDGHHNPLILLHNALSRDIHNESDENCLEIAQAIRHVLTDLARRISQTLQDGAEVKKSVSTLLKPRNP